jgi:hypothetical protein
VPAGRGAVDRGALAAVLADDRYVNFANS